MKSHERIKSPRKLQDSMGVSRVCEWQALAKVAETINAGSYCSVGCDGGLDFLALRENYRTIPAIGFDDQEPKTDHLYSEVEWYHIDGSKGDLVHMHEILGGFLAQNAALGTTLFYVNNRHKLDAMRELIRHVKPGSVIGTHDWGDGELTIAGTYTEVPEKRCGFLYEAGFQVFRPIESWIEKHQCIQKFWIKK